MRLKLFASFLARFSSRYSSCGDAQAVERASTIKRKTSILRRLAPAATNRGVLHFSPMGWTLLMRVQLKPSVSVHMLPLVQGVSALGRIFGHHGEGGRDTCLLIVGHIGWIGCACHIHEHTITLKAQSA